MIENKRLQQLSEVLSGMPLCEWIEIRAAITKMYDKMSAGLKLGDVESIHKSLRMKFNMPKKHGNCTTFGICPKCGEHTYNFADDRCIYPMDDDDVMYECRNCGHTETWEELKEE